MKSSTHFNTKRVEKAKILIVCPAPRDKREILALNCKHYTYIFHHKTSDDLERLVYQEGYKEGKAESCQEVIDDLLTVCRSENISGIISSDDYPGSIIASICAKTLDLPSPAPEVVLKCHHKYYSRLAQKEVVPEVVPAFKLINPSQVQNYSSLAFPMFLKPVKSYFSCFAQALFSFEEFQKKIIESIPPKEFLEPFNELLQKYAPFSEYNANYLIAEELLNGLQATIEGYSFQGEVEIIGIVDSIMYPNTISFKQFLYPSSLPLEVQNRAENMAKQCMKGIGFDNGLFNIEFFYNPTKDTLTIIEINPRMASQFSDLYEKVDGTNSYEILLDIATGRKPSPKKREGKFQIASSSVLRTFKNMFVRKIPDQHSLQKIKEEHPDTRIEIFVREGQKLSETLQDGKSYRYALIHLGGYDEDHFNAKYQSICNRLTFTFEEC